MPGEAPPASPNRASIKYPITQNSAMKRYPPIRWAAIKRVLAFASLTRADACRISQTLMAPTKTNATPSQTLVALLIMVELCIQPFAKHRKNPLRFAEIAPAKTTGTDYREIGGTCNQHLIGKVRGGYFEIKTAQPPFFYPWISW